MIAFCLDILVTPIESTIVTTAASPSGIAATARLTASINVSSVVWRSNFPFLISVNANINMHIKSTSFVSNLLRPDSLF